MADGKVNVRQADGAYHFASQDELDRCVRGTRRSRRILYAVGAAFALGAVASVANMGNGKRSIPFAILVTVVSAALAAAFVGLARAVGRDFLDAVDNHPKDVKVDGTSGTIGIEEAMGGVSSDMRRLTDHALDAADGLGVDTSGARAVLRDRDVDETDGHLSAGGGGDDDPLLVAKRAGSTINVRFWRLRGRPTFEIDLDVETGEVKYAKSDGEQLV